MIHHLGNVSLFGNTNASLIGSGTSQAGALWDDFTSALADLVSFPKYGVVPDATSVVISQAAPSSMEQMTETGVWNPELAASIGLQEGQNAQTQVIQNAISQGTYDPTGNYALSAITPSTSSLVTIAIVVGVGIGVLYLIKK